MDLPATLYADMSGSAMAAEAVLQLVLRGRERRAGSLIEVPLSHAAHYTALPRLWGLTEAGGTLGGGHAGYRIYRCKDGRVAVAALEPRFAATLCAEAGARGLDADMFAPGAHEAVARFMLARTRAQLDRLAAVRDIPLHTMPP
jgi:crotonobetainyl-CoA:carnitine CoA-transferase CaiB-like acyl-CoA transferase